LAEVLVSREGDRALLVPLYIAESRVGNIMYNPDGRALAQARTAEGVRLVYAEAGYSHAQYLSRTDATRVLPTSDNCMSLCELACNLGPCYLYCTSFYLGWLCLVICAGGCNMVCGCICYGCVCCGGINLPPHVYSPAI